MTKPYDSRPDTEDHVAKVQLAIDVFSLAMRERRQVHDASKFYEPEKSVFDEFTPKLKSSTYGSDEYKSYLAAMKPALDHHYAANSHHPEHFTNGIDGMTLVDLVEMFCDWKAATMRHADGSMERSIQINRERFKISPQLATILENTRLAFGW